MHDKNILYKYFIHYHDKKIYTINISQLFININLDIIIIKIKYYNGCNSSTTLTSLTRLLDY